jgi:hypothetical protein
MPAKIHKNGTKNGWFPALVDSKIVKNAAIQLKVLNKIYFEDVFEKSVNLKNFVTKGIVELYLFNN